MKTYHIIPHASIYKIKGKDAGDALINFATQMDFDMNSYFYSVENPNVICPYSIDNAISEIKGYAKRNNVSLPEALSSIEIRGIKVSDVVEIYNKLIRPA